MDQVADNLGILHLSAKQQLSAGLKAGRVLLANGNQRVEFSAEGIVIPAQLSCRELNLSGSRVRSLPEDLTVRDRIDLQGCKELVSLPDRLTTSSLCVRDCTSLKQLPRGIRTNFLDAQGCIALEELPDDLSITLGRLNVRDCRQLISIPESIGPLAQLDLAGCELINALPASLVVTSSIDLGGTSLSELPAGCQGVQLLWRDVPIDERIAFRPDEISGQEVLHEPNAERRRVVMERIGLNRFFNEIDAEILDEDTDPGGKRQLLRIPLEGDEDLVVVSVICPSTSRQYMLRVPPTMQTCHAAVAWTAGFDNPSDYQPHLET